MKGEQFIWSRADLPRKGWGFLCVTDHGEDSETCEMCGNPNVRYIHTLVHDDVDDPINVGCVCASHLETDPTQSRERERALRSRARKRTQWPKRWESSPTGHRFERFVKGVGHSFVEVDKGSSLWRAVFIDHADGCRQHKLGFFKNRLEAQLATFDCAFPAPGKPRVTSSADLPMDYSFIDKILFG